MGKMVDGLNGVQQWRPRYSDRHYTMQKLVKVNISKAWWTWMIHTLDIKSNTIKELLSSY
jgi:hypothetical protein